jgi:tape measure domain-containing protein
MALEFDVRLHMEQLNKDIQAINNKIDGFVQNTKKGGEEIDNQFKKIAGLVAGYFTLNFAGNLVKQIALVRGEFQQLEVAFRTMLGNKLQADQLMQEVVQFAAITPFELKDVASGAKSLLAFGVAAEDILPTLKSLGDVSAGLSVPIERLILNFGQVKTQAKLTGRELRDFNVAGVPIIAELAKNLGVAEEKINEMVSAGQIGFADVAKAFQTMSGEGGKFANLMFEQAKTITGQISNLKDAWNQMLNDIGKSNEGAIGGALKIAKELVENYETVISVLKVLVATYGAYKTAVILAGLAMQSQNLPGFVKQLQAMTAAIKAATVSWKTMELAQKATVIGLIAAAVTGLATALISFSRRTDDAANSMAEFQKEAENEKNTLNLLFGKIKESTVGTEKRKKAIDDVNNIYGGYIRNLLTEKSTLDEITTAQKNATAALEENMIKKTQEAELQPYRNMVDELVAEYSKKFKSATDSLASTQLGAFRALMENYRADISKSIDDTGIYPNYAQIFKKTKELFAQATGKKSIANIAYGDLKDLDELALSLTYLTRSQKTLSDATAFVSEEWETFGGIIDDAGKKSKKTADDIKATVSDQIDATIKLLTEANKKLNDLRLSTSKATPEDISTQEEVVKTLEKQLATLTGISKKENDKQIKQEEEKLKAKQELSDRLIELEAETQTKQIETMREGAAKRIAQLKNDYKNELREIEKQRTELIQKYNEAQGIKLGAAGYQTQLPPQDEQRFSDQRKAAALKVNREIEAINKESADNIANIWTEVTERFLSEQGRETMAILDKYNGWIAQARLAGDKITEEMLSSARDNEVAAVSRKYNLLRLEGEEEVLEEMKNNADDEYQTNVNKYQALLKLSLKYAQQKLEILKDDPNADKNEITKLELRIAGLQKAIKKINKDIVQSFAESVTTMSDFIGEYSEGFKEIASISAGIGSMIAGDWKGALQVLHGVIGLFEQAAEKDEQKYQAMIETVNTQIEKTQIMFDQIDKAISRAFGTEKISEFRQAIQALGNDMTWAISDLNNLARAALLLPDKDSIIGYRSDSESGTGRGRPGGAAIYGFSIEGIEKAITENETRINGLILEYAKSGNEAVRAILEAYQGYVDKLYTLKNQYFELLTGTTPDSIADSIVEGFKAGKSSAADFADTFEGLMKDAIIAALKMQVLEKPLQDFYQQFALYMEDGKLTADELSKLRAAYNTIISSADQWIESINDITGISPFAGAGSSSTMTGAIKGITEETAGIIAGQFYAMRENLLSVFKTGVEQLDIANRSMTYLSGIEKNTRDIAVLNTVHSDLQEMNRYLKSLL